MPSPQISVASVLVWLRIRIRRTQRPALLPTVLLVLGCAGSVVGSPDSGGGGAAEGSPDAGDYPDSGSPDAGPGWTVPPGQTYADDHCVDGEKRLWVEIYSEAPAECVVPVDVNDTLLLAISAWDGAPGSFTVGEETIHGTAHAAHFTDTGNEEEVEGTITVEPYRGTPRWISWALSVAEGRTDLGACGKFDDAPCAPRPP